MAIQLTAGFEPLPGYPLVELLGRGSYGVVWRADSPGGGQVALKFIPLDSDAAVIEQRALDFIKGIRHPNLLALFGSWQIDNFLMIGMELADRTLHSRLREARDAGLPGIPFEELIEYLAGVACGLDYLNACRHPHPQGGTGLASFQHRDVKPTNLFLVGDGVKVGDWGLLRLLEGTAASHTGHHTPAYAAPEFFHGKTTNRSDQYSLAVTAYFLRSGRLPFIGDMCDGHLNRPADLSGVANRRERQVLERALAKNPHERWPSCRDFVAALRAANLEPPPNPLRHPTDEEVPPTLRPPSTGPYGPGLKVPRFHYGSVVPPQSFVGRQQELADAQSIVRSGQSFLILGLHRAGKTSFCKKLIHELMAAPGNDLLPAYLNLQQLLDLTVETFLEHTLLNLMGEIARQVFRCKYTDLLRADAAAGYPELQNDPVFDSFVNIFLLVASRTQSSKGVSPPPLRAQEFVQFTHDLLDIIRRRGWSNFVIFYDEANRLPSQLSVDLLVSNEEALNTAGVVSVYVASPVVADAFRPISDSFGREVRLGPFAGIDDLRRLLALYCFGDTNRVEDLPVAPEAIDLLWSGTWGRPFLIQLVAGRSFEHARTQQAVIVGRSHVEEAVRVLRAEKPQYFTDE